MDNNKIDWDVYWEKVKKDKDKLLELLKIYGSQSELSRKSGIPRRTIGYWKDKHGIEPDDYIKYKEKNAPKRERRSKYEKSGDKYIIHHSTKDYNVEKELIQKFLDLYCIGNFTKNETANELEISRGKLNAIWSAFSITHDSIPHLEEDIKKEIEEEGNLDNFVEEDIYKERKLYWKKLDEKKKKKAYKELKKYYKRDYELDKISDNILNNLDKIDLNIERGNNIDNYNKYILVININDWHKGKRVDAYRLVDKSITGYNKEIFERYKLKFIQGVEELIELYQPEKIYILNYGDGPDDPNADTYEGQVYHQDIQGEDQLMSYVNDVIELILAVYSYNIDIYYSGVPGNHSNGNVNWDVLANRIIKKLLSKYQDAIEFDVDSNEYKIIEIYNNYLVQTHGQNIRNGKYTGENDILNIVNMAGLSLQQTYIVRGHLHHYEKEGTRYRDIILPSPIGGDELSSNILNVSSRPAQVCFLMDENSLKSEHYIYFD